MDGVIFTAGAVHVSVEVLEMLGIVYDVTMVACCILLSCLMIKRMARLARALFQRHTSHNYSPWPIQHRRLRLADVRLRVEPRSLISDHLPSLTACTPERLE